MSKYIVFEGVDGSGKTTLADMLTNFMHDNGAKVCRTKEPGSPHLTICKALRHKILYDRTLQEETLAVLFAADAYIHLREVVSKFIAAGHYVVSDRCMLSDYAYQPTIKTEAGKDNLEDFFHFEPHLIYVNTFALTCLERMKKRKAINPYEENHVIRQMDILQDNYRREVLPLFERRSDKLTIIDGNLSLEELEPIIKELAEKFMEEKEDAEDL